MAKQPVTVPGLPQPIGPFNYGVRSNGMLYVSGALGVDENWKVVAPNDVTAQSKKALETIKAILDAAQVPLTDVVKVTVFLTSAADYRAFNEVRRGFFPQPYPASTVVVVKELVLKDAVVEIEVIAEAK
jgi:2-iminobutanoate/2-iminopropanoate deaminase